MNEVARKRGRKSRPTAIPVPGEPVRGSKSGAPIMALFDLLGRRWAMGILWTLSEMGPLTFGALQDRCETISPTVLSSRLRELQIAGFVTKVAEGYRVTNLGAKLHQQLLPLAMTAKEWGVLMRSNFVD